MPRLIASLLAVAALLVAVPAASAQGRAVDDRRDRAHRGHAAAAARRPAAALRVRAGPHRARARTRSSSRATTLKPDVPGHIVRFKPDLEYADGTIPRVDVIHLHHGVWLSNFAPLFAAGEEKTTVHGARRLRLGVRPERQVGDEPHDPQPHADAHGRLHHLRPRLHPRRDARPTRDVKDVSTVWLDVIGGSLPGLRRPQGRRRRATAATRTRDEAPARASARARPLDASTQDGVLVGTAGHLHPGGLWTDLKVTRGGQHGAGVPLEGEVLRAGRRRLVGRGDDGDAGGLARRRRARATCCRSRPPTTRGARPGTSRWGSCPSRSTPAAPGPDPFATNVDVPGEVTHGHLAENRNHGGAFGGLPDARRLLSAPPRAARAPCRSAASSTARATSA